MNVEKALFLVIVPAFLSEYNILVNPDTYPDLHTFPHVAKVRYLHDYWLEIIFENGIQAEIDFHDHIFGQGGLLKSLEDPHFFAQVQVRPDGHALIWSNGVDFHVDVLYDRPGGRHL